MSYLDEAAQDMAESFKRIFITAFGHGYDFGCESKEGECKRLEAENAKLRKYVAWLEKWALDHASFGLSAEVQFELDMARRELGVEVSE